MRGRTPCPAFAIKKREVKQIRIYIYKAALMLLATLVLTACHDYEEWETAIRQPVDVLSRFNAEGKAWLSLHLGLPSGVTRTDFVDGDEAEYTVKTLTLVLFHGSSTDTEDQMTVASIYNVDYTPQTDTHYQITNHSMATIQISNQNISNGDKLYMLAIANVSLSIDVGTTFSDVKAMALSEPTHIINGTTYYVMASTPLASANDGTGSVTTLTEIDPAHFAASETDAQAAPAGYIYLERAAAKVTTKLDDALDMHVKGNAYIAFAASDFQYALFNYNMQCHLIRHMDATWLPYNATTKRFVEQAPLPNQKYRTYWARDINYEAGASIIGLKRWMAMGESDYCAENTFDVAHMQDDCTTSVLVRLQLNNGGDFYTTSVTGSDVIFQPPTNDLTEEGTSASSSFARRRSDLVTYDGTNIATIDDYLRQWLMEQSADLRAWVRDYAGSEQKHLKITMTNDPTTGTATATLSQTAQTSGTGYTKFETMKSTLQGLLNGLTIKFYDDGYCYYRVLIRHFSNDDTPWSSAATMTNNSTAQAYAGNETDYLGRYGVVRNNWYNINIKSVTHVGSPIIPALTDDADDKVEQLLNATLTISGWEGHEQSL